MHDSSKTHMLNPHSKVGIDLSTSCLSKNKSSSTLGNHAFQSTKHKLRTNLHKLHINTLII